MGQFADLFEAAWGRYVTPGVPASGKKNPKKDVIVPIGTAIDDRLAAVNAGYDASVALIADLPALANGKVARVYGEAVAGNRGVYLRGGGVWTRIGPLPGGDTAAIEDEINDGRGGLPTLADNLAKITRAGFPLTSVFDRSIHLDWQGLISGTPSVYIPRRFYGRRGVLELNGTFGAADGKLTEHVRLTFTAGNIWLVYADLADAVTPYKITQSTSPVTTDRPDEIVPLMVIFSNGHYWSPYRTVVIEPDDHLVIPRYPLIVDGDSLFIPEFFFWSRQTGFVAITPTDGARYFKHATSVNTGTIFRHFFDYFTYVANTADPSAAVKAVSGTNNPDGESRYFPIIAMSLNRTVRSRHAIAGRNHGGVRRNMFAAGKLPSRGASFLSTSSVAASSAPILAQGFAECVTAAAGQAVFYGSDLPTRAAGTEFVFGRVLLETSSAGSWGAPRLFVYNDAASVTSVALAVEEQISTTLRWYSFFGTLNTTAFNMFKIGVTPGAGVTMRAAGAQVYVGSEPAQWIMRGDYAADPGPMEPIYGERLYVIAGRRQSLYIPNILSSREDLDQYVATLSSVAGPTNLPYVVEGRRSIEMDPDRLGSTATLRLRRLGPFGTRDNVMEIVLDVRKAAAAGLVGSPGILTIGDSHPNAGLLNRINTKLLSTGLTPSWLGTIPTSITDGSSSATDGLPGECRGGRGWRDYYNDDPDLEMVPVEPGAEGAYLLASKTAKIGLNPFVRPSTGGDDPSVIFGGHTVDMQHYSTNYLAGVMPDIWLLGLGTNDAAERAAVQDAVDDVVRGLRVYITQIRLVDPTGPIGWFLPPLPRSYGGDERWAKQQAIIRAGVAYIRGLGDPNVDAIQTWAHISQEGDWQIDTTIGYNAATGVRTSRITDHTHLVYGALREQAAEAIAAWIAKVA